jgi:hypothetical protein
LTEIMGKSIVNERTQMWAPRKRLSAMTIIELNIVGLHLTRTAPDFTREAFAQSWRRLLATAGNVHWPIDHRSRDAADRSAA